MELLRSMLFVPALQPRFFDKAHERGADALILDLEDSIAPQRKAEARAAIAGAAGQLAARGMRVFVRINSEAELARLDIAASVGKAVHGLLLPKVETADQIRERLAWIRDAETAAGLEGAPSPGHTRLIPLIESPRGVINAYDIGMASDRLLALNFGVEDYACSTEQRPLPNAMAHAAQQVVVAARAAGLEALGLVGSIAGFGDPAQMQRIAERSRLLGFTGSPCIHPSQVPLFNDAFGVAEAAYQEAERIVTVYGKALAEGLGAVALDGKMIDIPVYVRARQTKARAELGR